jgi:hypothetical protein
LSVFTVKMNKQNQKPVPITRKIKRFFAPAKSIKPYKLYPEEYYKQIWLCHSDDDLVKAFAKGLHVSQKEAQHQMNEWALKYFMKKDLLEKISDPQSKLEFQESLQRRIARQLARKQGWKVNKLI